MQVVTKIAPIPDFETPIIMTIGFFDGVHLGHQALLKELTAGHGTHACLTFNNHPSTLFTPKEPTPLISSTEQRLFLLEKAGVDLLILLDFTENLAEQSAKTFLLTLRQAIPFSHLILGHDAHLGKAREGTPKVIKKIAEEEGFKLSYTDSVLLNEKPISSSQIRKAIHQGDLELTEALLGRKLSYLGKVFEGPHRGREVGYPTANIPLPNLALPPFGVYAITCNEHLGVANIGVAPTLHQDRVPMLEAHLFNFHETLYDQTLEVTLHHFIRPEKKFASIETLRTQIETDITATNIYFSKSHI